MNHSEKFINWLEGFLDACKNSPTQAQVKEIRKKLTGVRATSSNIVPLYDTISTSSTLETLNPQIHAEFIQAIEDHKNASTLEELDTHK